MNTASVNGREMKLGRNRSVAYGPRLNLARYLPQLPTPPVSCDYTQAAKRSLDDAYLNDELGICVVAGGFHVYSVLTGNAGSEQIATRAQLIKDYGNIGGYVEGRSRTDNGCDMQTALNWWLAKGFAGTNNKIEGWLAVDMRNLNECRFACWAFEHLFLAAGIPDSWLNINGSGFVWDERRNNPGNGHAFTVFGYGNGAFDAESWGSLGKLTDGAMRNVVEEAYVMIDDAILVKAQQRAPSGLDWPRLIRHFNEMGGNLPEPTPATEFDWSDVI